MQSDPFRERTRLHVHKPLQLMGARVRFDSNSRELLRLVDDAFAGLPRHRLASGSPELRISLMLTGSTSNPPGRRARGSRHVEPPPIALLHGAGLLGGSTDTSNFVVLSPCERAAVVVVSPQMLRSRYHTRYELIEFAVFTLAARVQRLVSLHAACVGRHGRGLLLMGDSGAGKSTLALLCLLQGLDFLSEDSVFVAPDTLLATGLANFLHVGKDSLCWLERARDVARIRRSPVIRRRSGVRKFELDLRQGDNRLAAAPLKISAVVFLSRESGAGGPLLERIPKSRISSRLMSEQPYAAGQPPWAVFKKRVLGLPAYELRRGLNPQESVDILRQLL